MKKIIYLGFACIAGCGTQPTQPTAVTERASDPSDSLVSATEFDPKIKKSFYNSDLTNCNKLSCDLDIKIKSDCSIDLTEQDVVAVSPRPTPGFKIKLILKKFSTNNNGVSNCNFGCKDAQGNDVAGILFPQPAPPMPPIQIPWDGKSVDGTTKEYYIYLKSPLTGRGVYQFTIQISDSKNNCTPVDPVIANG